MLPLNGRITGAGILAFRDVYGIRPLVIGQRREGTHADYIAASGPAGGFQIMGFLAGGNFPGVYKTEP